MEATRLSPDIPAALPDDPDRWEADDPSFIHVDMRRIAAVIRRNRWWIAGIVAASVLAGLLVTMLMVPSYTATLSGPHWVDRLDC